MCTPFTCVCESFVRAPYSESCHQCSSQGHVLGFVLLSGLPTVHGRCSVTPVSVAGQGPQGPTLPWPSASASVRWTWTPSDPLSCSCIGQAASQGAAGARVLRCWEGAVSLALSSAALHVTFLSRVAARGPLAAPNSHLTNPATQPEERFFPVEK